MTVQSYDKNGEVVSIGTKVKLLFLQKGQWFDQLSEEEKKDLRSMVGEFFEIEDINEFGKPEITKWWHEENEDRSMCHSLYVDAEQIEIVK